MRDFLFPEAADEPDDEYDHGNDNKYAHCHTGLKNIADYFTTCKGSQQHCKDS